MTVKSILLIIIAAMVAYLISEEYAPRLIDTIEYRADRLARGAQYAIEAREVGFDKASRKIAAFVTFLLWHIIFAGLILYWRRK